MYALWNRICYKTFAKSFEIDTSNKHNFAAASICICDSVYVIALHSVPFHVGCDCLCSSLSIFFVSRVEISVLFENNSNLFQWFVKCKNSKVLTSVIRHCEAGGHSQAELLCCCEFVIILLTQ